MSEQRTIVFLSACPRNYDTHHSNTGKIVSYSSRYIVPIYRGAGAYTRQTKGSVGVDPHALIDDGRQIFAILQPFRRDVFVFIKQASDFGYCSGHLLRVRSQIKDACREDVCERVKTCGHHLIGLCENPIVLGKISVVLWYQTLHIVRMVECMAPIYARLDFFVVEP